MISVILAPVGYVVQDVVADAMTVEAVPLIDETGNDYSKDQIKIMHTTMQTLGSCLLYTSPSPRDVEESRMPSSA